MSEAAVVPIRPEEHDRADADLVKTWRERIQQARDDRARYEAGWLSCLAFAAGKQHLVWDRDERKLYLPELNDGEDRYTADKIMQYRNTALGELTGEDERPQLHFRRDDLSAEEYAGHVNDALEYGWDSEFQSAQRLLQAKRTMIDLGTSGIRTRFDPTVGPLRVDDDDGEPIPFPHRHGRPILDPTQARKFVEEQFKAGRPADIRPIREGRIRWEVLTAFNLLVPPGIENEDDFPWEIVVRPVALEAVREEYGDAAAELKEDEDIGIVFGLGSELSDFPGPDQESGQASGKLRGHVWLFTCYQRPTKDLPEGQTVVLGSGEMRLLGRRNRLPCKGPDGTARSGLTYLHWWRITGRFWGKSLIEALKDPQRSINRRATQKNEIIDRGMPFGMAEEGSLPPRTGKPLEMLYVKPGSAKPDFHGGIGAGEWMYRDLEQLRQDMEEAAGIRGVSLGENPSSVTNYSQLALLRTNDQIKLRPTILDYRLSVKEIVENTVYEMGVYWGSKKHIDLDGPDRMLRSTVFDATKIPAFFVVKVPSGAPKPQDQAAILRMIQDVADYSVAAGAPLPPTWYADSVKAGALLPLPEQPTDDDRTGALYENMLMVNGQDVDPSPLYFGNPLVHIPEHRSLQVQAWAAGDMELYERVERHIRATIALEEAKAAGAIPGGGDETQAQPDEAI